MQNGTGCYILVYGTLLLDRLDFKDYDAVEFFPPHRMAATPLARFLIQNGVPKSVTLDAVVQVTPDQFFLAFTVSAVQYADLFTCDNPADQANLIKASQATITANTGSGSGTHVNCILSAGGPTSTAQPEVGMVSLIIE